MTVFGVLLLYWAASGIVMAIYDLSDPNEAWAVMGGGPGADLALEARGLPAMPSPESLRAGLDGALASAAGMPIASVDLRMARGNARLQLAEADGDRGRMRRFFAESGRPMTQDEAEDPAADAARTARHDWLKSWHRGDAAGLPGQLLGLLAGLALVGMLVTGSSIYLRMRSARRRAGLGGGYWPVPRESAWRRLHRWVSMTAAVLLLNTALTGLVLGTGEVLLQLALRHHIGTPPYPRPSPLPPVSEAPLAGDLVDALQRAYAAGATAAAPDAVTVVQLARRDGAQLGLVTTGGSRARVLAFDMQGRAIGNASSWSRQRGSGYFADWHQVVKRMHRGDIIGTWAGRYVALLNGCALLYLVVSGLMMRFGFAAPRPRA